MRARRPLVVVILLLCLVGCSESSGVALSQEERNDHFSHGKEAFRQATRHMKSDPDKAARLFDESIARFRRLHESGIANGKLLYNIGNAHLLKGDIGRAIASYRQAERLMPQDPKLQGNLAVARARAIDRIPMKAQERVLATLFFWHYDSSQATRLMLFLLSFNGIWLVFLAARRSWIRSARVPAALCLGLSLLLAGSLIVSEFASDARSAVIVAREVVGRKGPDAAVYQPSFKKPLHAGTEGHIIEERGPWTLFRLGDDRETWLPNSALVRID